MIGLIVEGNECIGDLVGCEMIVVVLLIVLLFVFGVYFKFVFDIINLVVENIMIIIG